LIFEDFDTFDQARLALRDQAVLKFGAETGPVKMPNYGQFRFTRVGGPTPDAPDVYSPSKNGWVSPGFFENSGAPIWPRLPVPSGLRQGRKLRRKDPRRARCENSALLVLDREFETQSVDPMALEPESGLAWYDAGRKNLNLVISVQSPAEIATAIAYLLGNAQSAFKPAHINTNFASCGGGFGGRDHTPFPLYVALAGMFFPNRPVRLANNRFEQFQLGIKRHAFKMRTQIGVDRATGKIVGFAADHALDGGGLANFSAQVASVGALAALGIYYAPTIRTPEILDKLEKHPIWAQRAAEKARGQQSGILVGTGVACATKNYGTGGDSCLGSVEIASDGQIAIYCDGAEMGNGLGTALANRVAAHLGGLADEVALMQVDTFGPLDLVSSGDSFTIDQKTQDAGARNPRWVPTISSATAASTGAYVGTHAAAEAARVIFRFGLWPAALELWGIAPRDPKAKDWEKARWKDGQLVMPGLTPLPLQAVAAKAHARNGVTGAMAHSFNRWAWARATFAVSGQSWTADIDALAVRRGTGKFVRIDRSNVKFPPASLNQSGPTYTAQCGTLVRIEIDRATGALRIAKAYSVLECGPALVPEIVLGQAQGGFAMGVGYALLETLPPYEDGPGNGKWNLGQYLVARGSDLPLHDLEVEVLPPVDPAEHPKGMAEVNMIPVVPALLNAIYDATGHRFRSLPVTQAMIKGVLK